MRHRLLFSAALLAAAAATSGCTSEFAKRGFVLDEQLAQEVRPGVDNQNSVEETLGRPTVISSFDKNVWFYISQTERQKAFFAPQITDQQILAVRFGDNGLVDEVKKFSLADAQSVAPVDDKTPTRGKELGLLEQLFGNIGRFSGSTKDPQGYQN
jgi:outer membrane protein assembly factor BamE (lipoprotein component of BamABCDE complex)